MFKCLPAKVSKVSDGLVSSRYPCTYCGKDFRNRQDCIGHMNSQHLHYKPHVCIHCSAKFGYKQSLKRHLVICSKKSNFYRWKSPFCHWFCSVNSCLILCVKNSLIGCFLFLTFPVISSVFDGRYLPSGKYRCDWCSKCFVKKTDMEGHVNSFHLKKKSLVCEYCNRAFYYIQSLNRHKKTCQALHFQSIYSGYMKPNTVSLSEQTTHIDFIDGSGAMVEKEIDVKVDRNIDTHRLVQHWL